MYLLKEIGDVVKTQKGQYLMFLTRLAVNHNDNVFESCAMNLLFSLRQPMMYRFSFA